MSSPRYQTRSNPFFLLFVEKPKEPTLCFQSFVMIHISHLEHFGRMTSGNSTLWNMIDDDTPSPYNSALSDMSPSKNDDLIPKPYVVFNHHIFINLRHTIRNGITVVEVMKRTNYRTPSSRMKIAPDPNFSFANNSHTVKVNVVSQNDAFRYP